MQTDLTLLEDFLMDNPDLERLEALIGEFNLFEVMGIVRQELRHSDFLAFLLNPAASHHLGDRFLKRFLMLVLRQSPNPVVNIVQIDGMDFSKLCVERESQNIDILIHNNADFVCLIENKISTKEHSDQLNRYLKLIEKRFPRCTTLIPILLSPDGDPPEDSESPFIPVSYNIIAEILTNIQHTMESNIPQDVLMSIRHYDSMLRRHILSNSEIAQLCKEIYQRHKAAIDLIIEHIPDTREEITNYLINTITVNEALVVQHSTKSRIRFFPKEWEEMAALQQGTGEWGGSNHVLLFEFYNNVDSLILYLIIGPTNSELRYEIYNQLGKTYKQNNKLTDKWTSAYKKIFLSKGDYAEDDLDELKNKINSRWQYFIDNEYQQIVEVIYQLFSE